VTAEEKRRAARQGLARPRETPANVGREGSATGVRVRETDRQEEDTVAFTGVAGDRDTHIADRAGAGQDGSDARLRRLTAGLGHQDRPPGAFTGGSGAP
jgi:hypothetical protein